MPRATADKTQTVRYDLKSCPEGFVELRKMDYGEVMHRRDIAADVSLSGQDASSNGQTKTSIQMNNSAVQEFEFSVTIVDHNLEDANGSKLNLTQVTAIKSLDPQIAQEIETLIDEMNKPPDADKVQSFRSGSSESDTSQQDTKPASS